MIGWKLDSIHFFLFVYFILMFLFNFFFCVCCTRWRLDALWLPLSVRCFFFGLYRVGGSSALLKKHLNTIQQNFKNKSNLNEDSNNHRKKFTLLFMLTPLIFLIGNFFNMIFKKKHLILITLYLSIFDIE